jgi:hypothetical protein
MSKIFKIKTTDNVKPNVTHLMTKEEAEALVLASVPQPLFSSACWLWMGAIDKNGYGTRRYGSRLKNKNYFAHRLSYYAFKGEIQEGMNINHTCDNPRCVNPLHLYKGTQAENMKDMQKRGRTLGKPKESMQGESHPQSEFTKDEVLALREAYKYGINIAEHWREFFPHLSYNTVFLAATGVNYRYV